MFHVSATSSVHFYNEETYEAPSDITSVDLVGQSEKTDDDLKLSIGVTPAGIVVCYFCENVVLVHEEGVQDTYATIKTYDVTTGQELRTFEKIKSGMFMSK